MGRVLDWRHEKRKRRALARDVTVFLAVLGATVVGGLAWTGGYRPLAWLDARRSQPLDGAIHVIDGDTIRVDNERIRIANIDTPEMPPRSRCALEAMLAGRATANLERLVVSGETFAFIPDLHRERDVYGRLLGRVLIDGEDVGRAQLRAGLAQRWTGRAAAWC